MSHPMACIPAAHSHHLYVCSAGILVESVFPDWLVACDALNHGHRGPEGFGERLHFLAEQAEQRRPVVPRALDGGAAIQAVKDVGL